MGFAAGFPLGRVAIWGVGLMGGSLGMALRSAGVVREVVGVDRDPEVLAEACRRGAVDRWTLDPAEAMAGADLVVLALPVAALGELGPRWAPRVPPGCVVTDLGSTKAAVVAAWESHLAPGAAFVGSHPMAGSERAGIAAARPDLFRGAVWVITPTERTPPAAVALVRALAGAVFARPVLMDPREHDRRVAYVSHLPQLVATALAAAAGMGEEALGRVLALGAGGFRDTTRLALSPGSLWQEILLSNREPVLEALAAFRRALDGLEAAVRAGDPEGIARWFARGRAARERFEEVRRRLEEAREPLDEVIASHGDP
ncbi:MAG: prephenate dehydrogenase/arogenate dehydrogenase family protein [Firmicutes bacterium]|nr:prephenate dehydrogenase/arogenate dehydrogenase family protein [Bacillota bacterium]